MLCGCASTTRASQGIVQIEVKHGCCHLASAVYCGVESCGVYFGQVYHFSGPLQID